MASIEPAWREGLLAQSSGMLHRRMVELSGNAALGLIAGMLHEISVRHTDAAISRPSTALTPKEFDKLLRSYERLVDLVRARDAGAAAEHWRRHMERAGTALLKGYEHTRVVDIML